MSLMPAAFIGHGNPMNALEVNRYSAMWRAFGASIPRPRAILAISAHWFIHATAVTAMPKPKTIHDFYGFPQELFDVNYPAPGLPELADEVSEVVKPTWVGHDHDSWGIDHGTWSVLVHAFPDADVPVVQLSINAQKPTSYHVELGAKLAGLRESGVLILGSGNVVHNLGRVDFSQGETGFDWAHRFDDDARELMTGDPASVPKLEEHRDYRSAVPTPDHFLPLAYIAGVSIAAGHPATTLIDGYVAGSLSMTSYTVGASLQKPKPADDRPGASLPSDVPPDETNL